MKIDEILKKESVIANLAGKNKLEVIKEMTECLKQSSIIKDDQALFETLMEREKLGSTGIGENVAIPHGKLPSLDRVYGVFAKLENPVDFEAIDNQEIDLVFLLIAPEKAGADHLQALSRISRMFRDFEMCKKLRAANNHKTLHKLLLNQA